MSISNYFQIMVSSVEPVIYLIIKARVVMYENFRIHYFTSLGDTIWS